ncbi:apolipoprotein acyltransferase [Platysternon megacephalum]|uniref:Apolipoprotein acyltransferase n=1 Tax=Platysternon megacephalum TaxID=55544 RepID=A0A4D9DLK2_9SAUR|nr:apolipoprotein acyltransferase [Platysternon megacephalum]
MAAAGAGGAGETKVIYHLDEEETPYLVKIPVPAERITLGHVKAALSRPGAKYFFKSMDQDFGDLKSDVRAEFPAGLIPFSLPKIPLLIPGVVGDPPARAGADSRGDPTGALAPAAPPAPAARGEDQRHRGLPAPLLPSRLERHLAGYESSSTLLTSEIETTSLCDSDDDDTMSRFSSSTEQSSASRLLKRHRRRRKQRPPRLERTSSFSSVTDSTMSLNIITVTLNMEKYNFLGISIVGQSNERGDGGIYIGSIMKGGAVAADGRIEPGDMLLQGYFTLPRNEPIQPIDPAAWVSHSAALTGAFAAYPGSSSMSTITSGSSVAETERFDEFNLSVHTDMASVTKAMASPESGLEVRDRMWLKITIPNAFLDMANLSLNDNDGSSGASDQDTLAPLPLPGATPWPLMPTFSYQYPAPHPYSTQPPPYHELSSYSYGMGSAGSQHSEGERPPGRLGSIHREGRGVGSSG